MLHAGGKFGGEGYKVSGVHGVGVSVVNALSEKLIARVRRDGKIYEMIFLRGEPQCEICIVGETCETGTTIQFWPDTQIFETVVFEFDILRARMRELAFLTAACVLSLMTSARISIMITALKAASSNSSNT